MRQTTPSRRARQALVAIAALLLSAGPAAAQPAAEWAAVTGPAAGPPRVIGAATLGCLAGAVPLPADGPGWQAVRVARNRHWGHPELVRAVGLLAARATAAGLPTLWIGDMAQPRGGPMPYGHASHQTGIDVDVWLDLSVKPPLAAAARERIEPPSVVRADGMDIEPRVWRPGHATLIRLAAELPGADRVLVNPAIKRALCRDAGGAPWLQRVRPWRGHDSHMHIRLRCPADQPDCRGQPPIPAGDGCDATLEWWFTEEARRPLPLREPGVPPVLPGACAAVLWAR